MDTIDTPTTAATRGDVPLEQDVKGRYGGLSLVARSAGILEAYERHSRFGRQGGSLAAELLDRWGRRQESGRDQLPYIRGASRQVVDAGSPVLSGERSDGGRREFAPLTGSVDARPAQTRPDSAPSHPGEKALPRVSGSTVRRAEGNTHIPLPVCSKGTETFLRQSPPVPHSSTSARPLPEEGGKGVENPNLPSPAGQLVSKAGDPRDICHRSGDGTVAAHAPHQNGSARNARSGGGTALPVATRLSASAEPTVGGDITERTSPRPTNRVTRPILVRKLSSGTAGQEDSPGVALLRSAGELKQVGQRSPGKADLPQVGNRPSPRAESPLIMDRGQSRSADNLKLATDGVTGTAPHYGVDMEMAEALTMATSGNVTEHRRQSSIQVGTVRSASLSVGRYPSVLPMPRSMDRPAVAGGVVSGHREQIPESGVSLSSSGTGQAAAEQSLSSSEGATGSAGQQMATGGHTQQFPGETSPSLASTRLSRDELHQVADQVYDIIEQRLTVEKERRGL